MAANRRRKAGRVEVYVTDPNRPNAVMISIADGRPPIQDSRPNVEWLPKAHVVQANEGNAVGLLETLIKKADDAGINHNLDLDAEHVKSKLEKGDAQAAVVYAIRLGINLQWHFASPLDDPADIGRRLLAGSLKGHREAYPGKTMEYRKYVQTWNQERKNARSDHDADRRVARRFGVNYKRVERARKKLSRNS